MKSPAVRYLFLASEDWSQTPSEEGDEEEQKRSKARSLVGLEII